MSTRSRAGTVPVEKSLLALVRRRGEGRAAGAPGVLLLGCVVVATV
jgi:hypothetical protein